jgi:hypothetical protein
MNMSFDYKRMTKFEHNVGDKEKQYRLYGGAAILAISVFMGEPFMLIIGLVLVATGYSGWCPAYSGLGKNTCVAASASPAPAPAAEVSEKKPATSKAKSKSK